MARLRVHRADIRINSHLKRQLAPKFKEKNNNTLRFLGTVEIIH